MGWTTLNRNGVPVKEFLLGECFTWANTKHKYTVLDSALVEMKTFYAAVERIDGETGKRDVWAAVILVEYNPGDGYDFGYKDMDESCGPNESKCPERILNLLTATESKYANDWRARCRENIAKRKAVGELGPGHMLTIYGKKYTLTHKDGRNWLAASMDGRTFKLTPKVMADATEIVAPPEAAPKVEPVGEQSPLF